MKGQKKTVAVVGGGAAGLMAAITAAQAGAHTIILERMNQVGKKLLSTGNGKCNLTNLHMSPSCYRSDNKSFPMKVIKQFPPEQTLDFFCRIGLLPKNKNGYIYPYSEQASSVMELLKTEAENQGATILCGSYVEKISYNNKCFTVIFKIQNSEKQEIKKIYADALILAAGGRAAPVLGSDGSGYALAKSLGHRIKKPLPALVQLCCLGKEYKQLAGIRTEAKLTLYIDKKQAVADQGELQLTDYGISGIPTFQISRFASKALDEKKQVTVSINFFPGMTKDQLDHFLFRRKEQCGYKRCSEFLTGAVNNKLSAVLLKKSGIAAEAFVSGLTPKQLQALALNLHSFQAVVTSTKPFENAQVCCGGVDTSEVNHATLESFLVPGLFLAGELLDVDGICGGYNLQWAWSSGYIAGKSAANALGLKGGK